MEINKCCDCKNNTLFDMPYEQQAHRLAINRSSWIFTVDISKLPFSKYNDIVENCDTNDKIVDFISMKKQGFLCNRCKTFLNFSFAWIELYNKFQKLINNSFNDCMKLLNYLELVIISKTQPHILPFKYRNLVIELAHRARKKHNEEHRKKQQLKM